MELNGRLNQLSKLNYEQNFWIDSREIISDDAVENLETIEEILNDMSDENLSHHTQCIKKTNIQIIEYLYL